MGALKSAERMNFDRRRAICYFALLGTARERGHCVVEGEASAGGLSRMGNREGERWPTLPRRSAFDRAVCVGGVWFVDSPRCAARSERDHDRDEVHVALVSYQMDLQALVDESLTGSIPVRSARGISAEVDGRCPLFDDHEARPGMTVPPERSARRDPVRKDVEVGNAGDFHRRFPRTDPAGRTERL